MVTRVFNLFNISKRIVNMLLKCKKFVGIPKFYLNFGASYCVKPRKFDPNEVHRAKPEEIPKGIFAEENNPHFTSVEEVKDRWHYVERLFPKLRIPEPPKQESSVGWKSPAETVPDLPYYVKRSRNHMLPVYEGRANKDHILVTKVTKIHGDIYLFEYDLKNYLEEKLGEELQTNVNEIACRVQVTGNHVETIKEWLYNKGF